MAWPSARPGVSSRRPARGRAPSSPRWSMWAGMRCDVPAPQTACRRAPTCATARRWQRWRGSPAPSPTSRPPRTRRASPRGPLPPGVVGELVADLTFVAREETPGGLDIHDFASLRGRRYEVVVIAGLDGDGYPSRPAADPLLADLRAPLADALPARAPGTSESRLRFVHAVDAADLTPGAGAKDGRRRRSRGGALALLARGLPARRTGPSTSSTARPAPAASSPTSPATARSGREALRAMALDGQVAPGPLAEAAARRMRPVGVAPDAFHDRTRLRVTELETFLRCPYGWFRDRYLAPAEMEELIDPRFEGTLAHRVLQRTYERMRDERVGPCVPETLDRYRAALEAVLPGACAEKRPPGAGARLRRPPGAPAAPPARDARPRGRARVGARPAPLRAHHGEPTSSPPRSRRGSSSRARSTGWTSRRTVPRWSWTTSGRAGTSGRRAPT